MKLVAMLGLVPSAHEMENAFLHVRRKGLGMRLSIISLQAIFTHRWSCGLVAPACTYAMGGEKYSSIFGLQYL